MSDSPSTVSTWYQRWLAHARIAAAIDALREWISAFDERYRGKVRTVTHGWRGPLKHRKRRGAGRGGGNMLAHRQRFKIKNITGTIVARPRHSSST